MFRSANIVAFAVLTLTLVAFAGTVVNMPHATDAAAAPMNAKSFCPNFNLWFSRW